LIANAKLLIKINFWKSMILLLFVILPLIKLWFVLETLMWKVYLHNNQT